MNERKPWECELTNVIDIARQAGLPRVVLAIQDAIFQIHLLKLDRRDLNQLKEILKERVR